MAIANMHHFKLYSMKSLTDEMLSFLQDYGDVHIKNLTEHSELLDSGLEYTSEPTEIVGIRDEISELETLIKLISRHEEKAGALESLKRGNKNYTYSELMEKGALVKIEDISKEVRSLQRQSDEKEAKIKEIQNQITELRPWTNLKLSSNEISNTRNVDYVTGYIITTQFEAFMEDVKELEFTHVEKVGEYDKNTYILAITLKEERTELNKVFRKYSFFTDEVKSEKNPVQEIEDKKDEIAELRKSRNSLENNLSKYVNRLDELKLRYEYLSQIEKTLEVSNSFLSTKRVNFVDGYVTSKEADNFRQMLESKFPQEVYIEMEPADRDDPEVPIVLENNKILQAFEPLTEMYAMPKYNEIDPTVFLAPFYWLFFGMMIADIGFGILILLGTWMIKRFNLSDSMRRNINFFHYLGYSTILWGIIYGSFFGGIIEFQPELRLIDPASDYMAVLIISVILGGFHMFLGLGISGYLLIRDGKYIDAFYDVGSWFLVLIGAIYWIVSDPLNLPYGNIGLYTMFLGMAIVLLFTGRDAKSPVGRIASGAYNLYGISSWVGDFVSYLRLMALGLSGAFIGVAINMIARTVAGSGIGGLVFAIIIFAGGQVFNLALSALSAYVHTLRLTFVEFFGKFYTGGGKKFEKVRNKTKYINIKKQEE